jgi:hypothetical protein
MIAEGAHGARGRSADLSIEGGSPAGMAIFGRGNRREASNRIRGAL